MTDDPPEDPPKPGVPVGSASTIDTAPTAGTRTPGEASVEVSADAFEPVTPTAARNAAARSAVVPSDQVPVSDPPSGDMRPLDMAHASDIVPADDVPAGYVAAPIAYDAPKTGPTATGDDEILPAALDDNALRDAIGAAPRRAPRKQRDLDEDDDLPRPAGRKVVAIAALTIIAGLGIAAMVFLGRANSQRFAIACTTDQVSAEQGRSFPPWGTRPLTGAEYKPITLPASAECRPRETDDRAELDKWFLELLVDRASTTLTARNLLESIQPGKTNPLDVVADQLNQALLLSRAPERRDQRKDVERLLGDVQYWRASLRLRDAAAALVDAARQFDAAAAQRPRHVTDAGEWAAFLRGLVDSLHAGPGGVAPVITPSGEPVGERPSAPVGTALPVEAEGSAAEPAATPDAGLPTGGVLL